ncbi:permease prefix domain 1-containing protein [Christensenella timonensis]|uniref:permease prefix domain 1-containing protein n=1 Tax=Christensenella timonensis TaxID=1816678 RepID=UPI00082BFE8A|nr:permease prefix domain 1-containing protein [Christensenella timonensis]
MEENLRQYVENLFADAPKSKKMIELRQEILMNLKEKYYDLIESGATEAEAFEVVKSSVGDVDELIASASDYGTVDQVKAEAERRRSAKLVAIAVALYILSPVTIIILGTSGQPVIGLTLMFALIAVATGLLVYNSSIKPKYEKMDDTMVEEFKQWQVETKKKNDKRSAYLGAFWSLVVALYFIVSFLTMAWYITWIIFLIAAAIEQIIKASAK